jgi:hypothetical protein
MFSILTRSDTLKIYLLLTEELRRFFFSYCAECLGFYICVCLGSLWVLIAGSLLVVCFYVFLLFFNIGAGCVIKAVFLFTQTQVSDTLVIVGLVALGLVIYCFLAYRFRLFSSSVVSSLILLAVSLYFLLWIQYLSVTINFSEIEMWFLALIAIVSVSTGIGGFCCLTRCLVLHVSNPHSWLARKLPIFFYVLVGIFLFILVMGWGRFGLFLLVGSSYEQNIFTRLLTCEQLFVYLIILCWLGFVVSQATSITVNKVLWNKILLFFFNLTFLSIRSVVVITVFTTVVGFCLKTTQMVEVSEAVNFFLLSLAYRLGINREQLYQLSSLFTGNGGTETKSNKKPLVGSFKTVKEFVVFNPSFNADVDDSSYSVHGGFLLKAAALATTLAAVSFFAYQISLMGTKVYYGDPLIRVYPLKHKADIEGFIKQKRFEELSCGDDMYKRLFDRCLIRQNRELFDKYLRRALDCKGMMFGHYGVFYYVAEVKSRASLQGKKGGETLEDFSSFRARWILADYERYNLTTLVNNGYFLSLDKKPLVSSSGNHLVLWLETSEEKDVSDYVQEVMNLHSILGWGGALGLEGLEEVIGSVAK